MSNGLHCLSTDTYTEMLQNWFLWPGQYAWCTTTDQSVHPSHRAVRLMLSIAGYGIHEGEFFEKLKGNLVFDRNYFAVTFNNKILTEHCIRKIICRSFHNFEKPYCCVPSRLHRKVRGPCHMTCTTVGRRRGEEMGNI